MRRRGEEAIEGEAARLRFEITGSRQESQKGKAHCIPDLVCVGDHTALAIEQLVYRTSQLLFETGLEDEEGVNEAQDITVRKLSALLVDSLQLQGIHLCHVLTI